MSINYSLYENSLTTDPNDYTATVLAAGSVDLEGVIGRMIERGSTVSAADALAVLYDYHAALESLVLEGFKVITPGANYFVSVKGVFDGPSDTYNSAQHSIEPAVTSGKQYRRAIHENAKLTKVESSKPLPKLLTYTDFSSGQSDGKLTSGGMAQIVGHRLKFDPADKKQGIFFTPAAAGGTVARVEIVGKNKPGELMFMTPATLAPGEYTVSVRAAFGKELRTGLLGSTLVVS